MRESRFILRERKCRFCSVFTGCEGQISAPSHKSWFYRFMKRKTVQTKYDVPVRRAFRQASEESCLHGSQRKSYLSVPFFFHLRCEWLVRGRLYMPGQRHELHHKICNLRYGTPGYGMSVYEITAKFKRFLLYKSHCSKAIQKWIAFLMSQNFSYKNRKPFGSRKY